jgi:hypothetical protein
LDAILNATRQALEARRAETRAVAEGIKRALDRYFESLDAIVLAEFAARNGLDATGLTPSPADAAKALRDAVLALPELTTPVVTPPAEGVAPEAAPPASERTPSREIEPPESRPSSTQLIAAPAHSETRLRPSAARLDSEGETLRAEFEAIDFDGLGDAEFASYATEFAARARMRQERGLAPEGELEGRIIRRLTALAHQRTLPRPVFGLSRSHTGDWAAIAARARADRERRGSSDAASGLTHRLAIPPVVVAKAAATDDASDEGIEEEPLELQHLRARAASGAVVMVGGVVKNDKLDRVRRRTEIDVEWIGLDAGKSDKAVSALAKRVREGRLAALVVLNGLMNHKDYEPLIAAAREVDLPVAYADKAGKGALVRAFVELEKRLSEAAA